MTLNNHVNQHSTIINDINNESLYEKINLYKQVFGEEPRNEGYQCKNPECSKVYYALSEVTKNELKKCLYCEDENELHECYPEEELKKDWIERSKKDGYVENLAQLNDIKKLIGFILGRNCNMEELNQEKFGLKEDEINKLMVNIANLHGNFDPRDFFYFSEIGIHSNHRHTQDHTASRLYESMEEGAIKNGKKFIVLRTTKKPGGPYNRFKNKLGYDVVFDYEDVNDRIIMVKKLNGSAI